MFWSSGFFTAMLVSLEAFICFSRAPSISSTVYLVSTTSTHTHVINRRPLRDNPKANRGRLKYYNGSIRKHYVWQVQGLQGAFVLHLLLVWITLIIFVTDVCFTGHGGTQLNGACLPMWRVWRTRIITHKKNGLSLKNWKSMWCQRVYSGIGKNSP